MRHVFFPWVLSLGVAALCACSSTSAKNIPDVEPPSLTPADTTAINKIVEKVAAKQQPAVEVDLEAAHEFFFLAKNMELRGDQRLQGRPDEPLFGLRRCRTFGCRR